MDATGKDETDKGQVTAASGKEKKTPKKKDKDEAAKTPTQEKGDLQQSNKKGEGGVSKKSEGGGNRKGEGGSNTPNIAPTGTQGTEDLGASKADLKRMRREKQEQERKKKLEQKESAGSAQSKKPPPPRVADNMKADVAETRKKVAKKLNKQQIPRPANAQRNVALFQHLSQNEGKVLLTQSLQFGSGGIHPAVVKLGIQYAEGVIIGSNARCVALLAAMKSLISDYVTPPTDDLCRDLISKLKPNISFLNQCRPLSVSMGTAIKYLKYHISKTPTNITETAAKTELYKQIEDFIHERIVLAAEAISSEASHKISDGDVILIYSCSSLIRRVLVDAHKQKKKFRVIVVDSRPKMEGKEALRRLVKEGIQCTYVLIGAVSYVITEATKVLLGAHGLLANGFLMSRVGTALVSLLAKSSNVPVLVCCETYKFSDRVQTDSFVFNELGDPDDLVDIGNKTPYLRDWRQHTKLTLLNLVYDFTPPEFVSMVITELGMIPCTSVPVVLRMKQAETNET